MNAHKIFTKLHMLIERKRIKISGSILGLGLDGMQKMRADCML